MADNIPSIPGGVPPKPEQSKVQPKKETVRINLPPKPSAAPTIKLPTLPPGGPTAAPGAPTFTPPAPSAPAPRPATAAPVSAIPQPRAQQRPAPVPVAAVSGLDKALAIVAAVAALAGVGTTVWMMMILQQALEK
jgi:hypothetical protein